MQLTAALALGAATVIVLAAVLGYLLTWVQASVRVIDENGFDLIPGGENTGYDEYRELRIAVLRAERDALLRARTVGSYSSEALSKVLEVLDADEIGLQLRGTDDER